MGRKMSTKTLNSRSSAEDDSAEEVEGIEAEEEDSLAPKTKAKGSKPGKKAAVPSKSAKKAAERKEDEEDVEDEEVEEEVSPAPKTKAKGGKPSKKAAAPSKSVKRRQRRKLTKMWKRRRKRPLQPRNLNLPQRNLQRKTRLKRTTNWTATMKRTMKMYLHQKKQKSRNPNKLLESPLKPNRRGRCQTRK